MKKVSIFVGSLALVAVVALTSAFSTSKSSAKLFTYISAQNICKFSVNVDDQGATTLSNAAVIFTTSDANRPAQDCQGKTAHYDLN